MIWCKVWAADRITKRCDLMLRSKLEMYMVKVRPTDLLLAVVVALVGGGQLFEVDRVRVLADLRAARVDHLAVNVRVVVHLHKLVARDVEQRTPQVVADGRERRDVPRVWAERRHRRTRQLVVVAGRRAHTDMTFACDKLYDSTLQMYFTLPWQYESAYASVLASARRPTIMTCPSSMSASFSQVAFTVMFVIL